MQFGLQMPRIPVGTFSTIAFGLMHCLKLGMLGRKCFPYEDYLKSPTFQVRPCHLQPHLYCHPILTPCPMERG